MLSQTMLDELNNQINEELYSAYIYFAMSGYLEDKNLPGAANWMRAQAQEELGHVMRFYHYIKDRRGRIMMKPLQGPPNEWDSFVAVFDAAFKHEQHISGRIHKLAELAAQENDHATLSFLKWFIDEQVEEEASVDEVLQKLKMIGGQGHGLFMIDRELGARKFKQAVEEED